MPTQGPSNPTVGADDATVGTVAWSNPGNITLSDDSKASAAVGASGVTHYLKGTGFSFSLPPGAIVQGITVAWECVSDVPGTQDNAVRLVKGGAIGATDRSAGTNWNSPSGDTVRTYGSGADLWGDTWSYLDINGANFGAVISAKDTFGGGCNPQVDNVKITVTYILDSPVLQQVRMSKMIGWF